MQWHWQLLQDFQDVQGHGFLWTSPGTKTEATVFNNNTNCQEQMKICLWAEINFFLIFYLV
jgi:hypothetical protein